MPNSFSRIVFQQLRNSGRSRKEILKVASDLVDFVLRSSEGDIANRTRVQTDNLIPGNADALWCTKGVSQEEVIANAPAGSEIARVWYLGSQRWLVAGHLSPDNEKELPLVLKETQPEHLSNFVDTILHNLQVYPPTSSGQAELVLGLSGGAARSIAHVGVLEVLRAREVKLVGMAGTSAGGFVAAMACMGLSPAEMIQRFVTLAESEVYRSLKKEFIAYQKNAGLPNQAKVTFRTHNLGFLSLQDISACTAERHCDLLKILVGEDRTIESLQMPLAVTTTNLTSGETSILRSGSLYDALRATSAVPGLFPPVERDGELLVDGSAVNEAPTEAMEYLDPGAKHILIHLQRPTTQVDKFANSLEIASRLQAIQRAHLVREQLLHAPRTVSIPVRDFGWIDFHRAVHFANLGRLVAECLPWP